MQALISSISTSRRFGWGAMACRFGCRVVGGDDARHYPIVAAVLNRHGRWRRPVWIARGDMRSLLYCLPPELDDTVNPAVWHYVVARAVASATHRRGFASKGVAHTLLVSECLGHLTRAPRLRAHGIRE